ncbi:MAG: NHL repeat-containing protein [Pirellulales bacterium]
MTASRIRQLLIVVTLTSAAATAAPPALDPAAIQPDKSLAQPGAVPAPVAKSSPAGLEIINWATQSGPTTTDGQFTLQLKAPTLALSILAYNPGQVSYKAAGQWTRVPSPDAASRQLQVIPLPAHAATDALRLTAPSKLKPDNTGGTPAYVASIPFATLLSFRTVNIAPQATVVVSSAAKPSQGFQPQPWVNRPETLVDGFIDARQNFFTAARVAGGKPVSEAEDITADKPEWIALCWDPPQQLRTICLLRGSAEKGIGNAVVEIYTGTSDPRFVRGTEGWKAVPGQFTAPGQFRSIQYLDLGKNLTTRALRIRCTGGVKQMSLGEIVVLRDLGQEAAPIVAAPAPRGVTPIEFTIPGPGKVTIQVRDQQGKVVANPVTGVSFPAGKNTAYWNLEDIVGKPILQPGRYSWRAIYVPGLKVEYKYTYFPYPLGTVAWQTPDMKGGWLADHEAPRTICRQGDKMWLGAFAEAGDSTVEVDAQANKLWGINRIWLAEPAELCSDGEWIYFFSEGGWIKANQAIIQLNAKTKESRKIFQRELPQKQRVNNYDVEEYRTAGPTGFQVVGNLAFVSFAKGDLIQVFDLTKGLAGPWRGFGWDIVYQQFEDQQPVIVKEIKLPSPGRIRKYGDGKLVATSGKDIVTIDLKTYAVTPLIAGKLTNPLGLGVDAQGNVYVGEGAPLHQVIGYSPKGEVIATLGKPGRREIGAFDNDNLEEPFGVEVGPDGRVWVMEHTDCPKRVSLWDPKTGKCVKAVYGPTQYGGGGCIDPENENRLFYKGMEFRRDPATGTVTPVNLMYRPDSERYARFSDFDYPCYAFRSEGKLWFTSFMWPHGHPSLVLWQYKGDHVMPVAAVGSVTALRQAFNEPPVAKKDRQGQDDTSFLTKHVPGYKEDQKFFTWTDLNDDGKIQPAELKFGKLEFDGKLLTRASAAWNWRVNAKFEAAASAGAGRMVFFRPTGRSPQGYPLYDVPTATVQAPSEPQGLMPDSKGNAIVLGGPLTCVAPNGSVPWTYRNDWPGLHAGHATTARGDEPGVLIAPTRIWGIAPVNDALGEVVCFNSNLGCVYLMTTDDGLYIDRVFRDQRVGLLWNHTAPPPPEVLAETSLYDEHFGGTFQKVRGADGKDHFYFVCGKNHCSVVELTGLDEIQRLPGSGVSVTPAQIAEAQERRQIAASRKIEPKVYTMPKVADGAIKVDGNGSDAGWSAARIDGFALAYDSRNLYILFKGRDDRAIFQNKGTNPLELFKTGDVVDVMLQTRADAKPNRTEAGAGDIRLSFAMFQDQPICVLYDFKIDNFQGRRVPFSSPWRTIWCDKAGVLDQARVKVTRGANSEYTLEASVPLAAIHLDPATLRETRGDVGRVMSDQSGTAATSRVYWSNKNTNIMSDVPSEAALQPNLWGLFRFEGSSR